MTAAHLNQDAEGSRLGMWLFLFSELMLFGGLFIVYAVYLARYPADFAAAGHELNSWLGATNTVVLLTSSLLAAMAVSAVQMDKRRLAVALISGTLLCAAVFLCIKYVEWGAKFAHGLYPNASELSERPHGQILFFGLYFMITGLHAVHVLAGATLLAISLGLIGRGKITCHRYVFLENSALYWHLVDLIWIFIFPLFYLIV
ncbi:MAG: cytochrome C oxidase subunit III [Lentisphaerae bacterium RIFOXYB12_FULL_65_16]|nr:MAG: cytochrome C oxidase subunit III [Lentisphaerae bacterium RIFOXYA12_64_32]OGV90834.1 MAG: cytochrome C oxidase subunit III [Lentisphaerae bacterium RIFOXYB12_FULL_65_16]